MIKVATVAEKRPVYNFVTTTNNGFCRLRRTKTRRPFASSFQALVMRLSYSSNIFKYVDHIVSFEIPWAVAASHWCDVKAYPILPTYLHHVFHLPGEMRLFLADKNVFSSTGTYYANVREGGEEEYEMWHRVVGDMTGHDYGLRSNAMPDPDRTPLVKLPSYQLRPFNVQMLAASRVSRIHALLRVSSNSSFLFSYFSSQRHAINSQTFLFIFSVAKLEVFSWLLSKKKPTGVTKYGLW